MTKGGTVLQGVINKLTEIGEYYGIYQNMEI